jgi:hypothetical protein
VTLTTDTDRAWEYLSGSGEVTFLWALEGGSTMLGPENLPAPGVLILGLGCSPLGILVSLLVSVILTLLANMFLRRRQ